MANYSQSKTSLKKERELGITEVVIAESSHHPMIGWDQEERLDLLKLRSLEKGPCENETQTPGISE